MSDSLPLTRLNKAEGPISNTQISTELLPLRLITIRVRAPVTVGTRIIENFGRPLNLSFLVGLPDISFICLNRWLGGNLSLCFLQLIQREKFQTFYCSSQHPQQPRYARARLRYTPGEREWTCDNHWVVMLCGWECDVSPRSE